MSRLRMAVIGAGHLGRIHARLLRGRDDVELIAVVDPVAAARDAVAAEFQTASVADYRSLDGRIDAAVVATPTQFHHEVARDLLQRGIHALVEKPITTTVAEAESLIVAAARGGLVLQVGHVERFNPALRAVRPRLGTPRYIEGARTSGYSFRSTDIGVVLDLMIHDLDIVLSLTGEPVVDVAAVGVTVVGPCEDVAQARLETAGGCVINLSASRTSLQAQRSMQIYSDGAIGSIDMAAGVAKVLTPCQRLACGEFHVNDMPAAEKAALKDRFFQEVLPVEELVVEKRNAIQDEHSDFVESILTGKRPLVTGEDGRNALAVATEIVAKLSSTTRSFAAPSRPAASPFHAAHTVRGPHFALPVKSPSPATKPPTNKADSNERRKAG